MRNSSWKFHSLPCLMPLDAAKGAQMELLGILASHWDPSIGWRPPGKQSFVVSEANNFSNDKKMRLLFCCKKLSSLGKEMIERSFFQAMKFILGCGTPILGFCGSSRAADASFVALHETDRDDVLLLLLVLLAGFCWSKDCIMRVMLTGLQIWDAREANRCCFIHWEREGKSWTIDNIEK